MVGVGLGLSTLKMRRKSDVANVFASSGLTMKVSGSFAWDSPARRSAGRSRSSPVSRNAGGLAGRHAGDSLADDGALRVLRTR